ncbi:hypothetical protein [Companilactobacillus ginsenosidimutans]|uniref:Uncharacterized protein n=1 Tax=Companilactobacillus ginsenosidimutans TaxID=1007676 RepID=A0A0H4QHR8_9LACO|nr:hypothetical protein [Companilactobacillus ginsenosidimutans]AKP66566.1 hypothetical protein ABM34_02685 [Companilactobacillus ginsenosidimutans]
MHNLKKIFEGLATALVLGIISFGIDLNSSSASTSSNLQNNFALTQSSSTQSKKLLVSRTIRIDQRLENKSGGGNIQGASSIIAGYSLIDLQVYSVGNDMLEYDLDVPYTTLPMAMSCDIYLNSTRLDSFSRNSTTGRIGYSKQFKAGGKGTYSATLSGNGWALAPGAVAKSFSSYIYPIYVTD